MFGLGLGFLGDNGGFVEVINGDKMILLAQGGIPLIAPISSGSISAAGALTGITSLGATYASAYCWFPANAVATVAAAGFRYCTFSSGTAGTVFLDTYTPGTPAVIPASPTPVTDGKGSYTGVTSAITLVSANVANLGLNGALEIDMTWANTNSAGTKTTTMTLDGTTIGAGIAVTTQTPSFSWWRMQNQSALAVQSARGIQTSAAAAPITFPGVKPTTIDTSVLKVAAITNINNTATDNTILLGYAIRSYPN